MHENPSLNIQLFLFIGDTIYDLSGNIIGDITEKMEWNKPTYIIVLLQADVYDEEYFVSEMPLKKFSIFSFVIDKIAYHESIVGVFP